ncbi:hypothetical protein PDENDC454_26853 [Paenibacillus dendritiformis C454]|uniref:Uncharacterized protein n=1 Tax=Paenibacillus dendritiformis C454 TaxID=1131935 RepID=H3SP62_9BACL|nr:hypothetical protein PDENDC454_26853 [Paenibacillus dendritiformis C454]
MAAFVVGGYIFGAMTGIPESAVIIECRLNMMRHFIVLHKRSRADEGRIALHDRGSKRRIRFFCIVL